MSNHRGKIGRLSAGLREQVNRRLENGEKGGVARGNNLAIFALFGIVKTKDSVRELT